MDMLHTIIFWLTALALAWLILLSCVRWTSTRGYRVFPSRELFVVILLISITVGLPRIDSTNSSRTSEYVEAGLSYIENALHQLRRETGPPRITGVQPDPASPNLWTVAFSKPIICTGTVALVTRAGVRSMWTQDCTGEPRTVLRFRFNKLLEPGTQITKFGMIPGSHIVGLDGEPLSSYAFDPVLVQER